MKQVIKWVFILLVGIVIAGLLLPFVFEDEIKENLKDEINKTINAKVNFDDIDLSLFNSFPQLGLSINDLSITGIEKFEGIELFRASEIKLSLPIQALFNSDNYEVAEILVYEPKVNTIILNKTEANYLITKESSDSSSESSVKFNLDNIEFIDASIHHEDKMANQEISLSNLNIKGTGEFDAVEYDMNLSGEFEELNFSQENLKYLSNAQGAFSSILHIKNTDDIHVNYKEAQIDLNGIHLSSDGEVSLNQDESIDIDMSLSSSETSFKSIMSIIPGFYTKEFENIESRGKASVSGKIKGLYQASDQSLPGFNLFVDIKDGFLKYPEMPKSLQNVNIKANITSKGAHDKQMFVEVPQFNLQLGEDKIDGMLQLNATNANGKLNGTIDLQNWKDLVPNEELSSLSGIVNMNLSLDALISDIEQANYANMKFDGIVEMKGFEAKAKDVNPISSEYVKLVANPEKILVNADNLKYGKSDFQLETKIENPLSFLLAEGNPKITIKSDSKLIDLNDMMPTETETSEDIVATSNEEIDKTIIPNIHIEANADRIDFDEYRLTKASMMGSYGDDVVQFDHLKFMIDDNDFNLRGKAKNTIRYLNSTEELNGDFLFTSKHLNLNDFMVDAPENSSEELEVIPIPKNVNLQLNCDIEKLTYDKIDLKNMQGNVSVKDQTASLNELIADGLGGQMAIQGSYATKEESEPQVNVNMAFSEMRFEKAFKKLDALQKIAPIAKYMNGTFNSTFSFSSDLDNNMTPNLTSINASGFLETLNGIINDFIPFNKIFEKLNMNPLNDIKIEETRNWFEVHDGRVDVKPFDFNYQNIGFSVFGSHMLDGGMDYAIEMKIPREMLKSNALTSSLESGLSVLEKQAGSLGLNIDQGENIDILVKLSGLINDPKIAIKPLGSSGAPVKDQVKGAIKDELNDQKEVIVNKANEEIEQVKDSVKTEINKEVDKVVKQVEDKKDEVVDTVKKAVVKKAVDLVDKNIPDSIGGTNTEEIKDKAEEEIDKIKDKLGGWNPFKKKEKKE